MPEIVMMLADIIHDFFENSEPNTEIREDVFYLQKLKRKSDQGTDLIFEIKLITEAKSEYQVRLTFHDRVSDVNIEIISNEKESRFKETLTLQDVENLPQGLKDQLRYFLQKILQDLCVTLSKRKKIAELNARQEVETARAQKVQAVRQLLMAASIPEKTH